MQSELQDDEDDDDEDDYCSEIHSDEEEAKEKCEDHGGDREGK